MLKKLVLPTEEKIQEKNRPLINAPVGCGAAALGGFSGGGETPVSPPPLVVNTGIDTLVITYNADICEATLDRLKNDKLAVQQTSDACLFHSFGASTLFAWNLQRTGVKFYPYVLKTGDITLCISTRDAKSSMPSMTLSIGSISCSNNLPNILMMFKKWCKNKGITLKKEKVSRVDICADLALDITKQSLWNQAKMITKAHKVAVYYSRRIMTGVQVGTGDIVLRMYDKIAEMEDKQAGHKQDHFQKIWNNQKVVTRVEFQLRREAIKSLCPGRNDFSALTAKLPSIWAYLTEDWFRQTAKAVDRLNKNQSKSTVSEFWLNVQSAFNNFNFPKAIRDRTKKTINIEALVAQAAGLMTTVCAAAGHAQEQFFAILETATQTLEAKITEKMALGTWAHDFNSRLVAASVSF